MIQANNTPPCPWPATAETELGSATPRDEPPNPFEVSSKPKPRIRRLARALLWRLALTPILLVAFMLLLVHGTTHRWPVVAWGQSALPAGTTPAAVSVFYREVELKSPDGVALAAWHVPAWSAHEFVLSRDQTLRVRHPAVILCHGPWADRTQWLYLVPALHAAGYELLLPDLRGCGGSQGQISLGLNEWQDVQAAITWLKRSSSVDPQRIALVGLECNAAAILRAAAQNPGIRAVAADRPCRATASFLRQRFNALHLPGVAMGRLYEWSLALTTGRDMSQASAEYWAGELSPNQAMLVSVRQDDRLASAADPMRIFSAAGGPKRLGVNASAPETPHQPALLPGDLLKFLADQFQSAGATARPPAP